MLPYMSTHSYTGTVIRGGKRATRLGFPTANLSLEDDTTAGIYAAEVEVDGTRYRAITYADQKRKLLETHLIDADVDLYGKEIAVTLLKKLRDDEVFADEAVARARIAHDVITARRYFKL